MMICGHQSIVEVKTNDLIPADEGAAGAVEFTVHVESYGFTATRHVFIEQSDVRTFVAHLRAIAQVRPPGVVVTLAATPASAFQLNIKFVAPGRTTVSGRMVGTDAGQHIPALEFAFEFDPDTLPTIVAEAERWIAPPRPSHYLCKLNDLMDGMDEARAMQQFTLLASILDKLGYELGSGAGTKIDELWAYKKEGVEDAAQSTEFVRIDPLQHRGATAFERNFLGWLHVRLGILPERVPDANGWWTVTYNNAPARFIILAQNGWPERHDQWLLHVEQPEPAEFIERVERHFQPGSGIRRRLPDRGISVRYTSSALSQPFIDQSDHT